MNTLTVTETGGLGMWFQADVARVLAAVHTAIVGPLAVVTDTPAVRAYRAGHENTLQALAVAFGLAYAAGPELTP